MNKKKRGFGPRVYEVYIKELQEFAKHRLPEGHAVKNKLIRREYINKILNAVANPRLWLHYNVIWNLLAFEIWYDVFIERDDIKNVPRIKI